MVYISRGLVSLLEGRDGARVGIGFSMSSGDLGSSKICSSIFVSASVALSVGRVRQNFNVFSLVGLLVTPISLQSGRGGIMGRVRGFALDSDCFLSSNCGRKDVGRGPLPVFTVDSF